MTLSKTSRHWHFLSIHSHAKGIVALHYAEVSALWPMRVGLGRAERVLVGLSNRVLVTWFLNAFSSK